MLPASRRAEAMAAADVDLIIARAPEHVLYLTGHWPVTGPACALATRDELALIFPAGELYWVPAGFAGKVVDYNVIHDETRLRAGEDALIELIPTVIGQLDAPRGLIGVDADVALVAPTIWAGETHVLSPAGRDQLAARLDRTLVDITPMLADLRAVKTDDELARIRTACNVAEAAIATALANLDENTTEAALAAAIEYHVHAESSATQRRRCFAAVMSGSRAATAGTHFNLSSDQPIPAAEPALIEMGVCVEGYWTDITRGFTLGPPSATAREQAAALEAIRGRALAQLAPGASLSSVDAAARAHAKELFGPARFHHPLGHGVGLRYHEPPILHPAADALATPGMVLALEPGVYEPKRGGLRIEDVYVVTDDGPVALSRAPSPPLALGGAP